MRSLPVALLALAGGAHAFVASPASFTTTTATTTALPAFRFGGGGGNSRCDNVYLSSRGGIAGKILGIVAPQKTIASKVRVTVDIRTL